MNGNAIREIGKEGNPSKIGVIISAIIIFGGILPNIEIGNIRIFFPDTILLMLIGFTSLFFFVSIEFNRKERVERGYIISTIPVYKSPLSKTCIKISALLFIFAILRAIVLIILKI